MEVLYDKEYAEISYDAAHDLVYLELKGILEGENYRNTFLKIIEIGRQTNSKRLLINQAPLQRSTMEAKAWLITTWLPLVKKTFPEDIRVALILSNNLFTKLGAEFVVATARKLSRFEVRTFSSEEDAKVWLLKDLKKEG